jgi:hypothetical protein
MQHTTLCVTYNRVANEKVNFPEQFLITSNPSHFLIQRLAFTQIQVDLGCVMKEAALRKGCTHMCGTGHAPTAGVVHVKAEQLTLFENDPRLSRVRRKVLPD